MFDNASLSPSRRLYDISAVLSHIRRIHENAVRSSSITIGLNVNQHFFFFLYYYYQFETLRRRYEITRGKRNGHDPWAAWGKRSRIKYRTMYDLNVYFSWKPVRNRFSGFQKHPNVTKCDGDDLGKNARFRLTETQICYVHTVFVKTVWVGFAKTIRAGGRRGVSTGITPRDGSSRMLDVTDSKRHASAIPSSPAAAAARRNAQTFLNAVYDVFRDTRATSVRSGVNFYRYIRLSRASTTRRPFGNSPIHTHTHTYTRRSRDTCTDVHKISLSVGG